MFDATTSFVSGLAAMLIGIGGLCYFGYDAYIARKRLRHRVDQLAPLGAPAATTPYAAARRPAALLRSIPLGLKGAELELARRLAPLHLRTELAPRLFVVLQIVCAALAAAGFAALGRRYAIEPMVVAGLVLMGGAVGWRLPYIVGDRLALQRRRAIARGLPEAIELLVIAVEAGLSLDDAINRIIAELRYSRPAIADELAITGADLKILPNREEALRRLVERVDLPSMHSIVTTLSQTLRYGTPVAQALRVVAAELRNDALMRLEEQTNRLPVLLTIPMIAFILPSLLLIIMGPAALSIVDAFFKH